MLMMMMMMEKWHAHSNEPTLQCVRTLAKTPCRRPVAVAVGEAGRKPEKPGINGWGIHSMSPVANPTIGC